MQCPALFKTTRESAPMAQRGPRRPLGAHTLPKKPASPSCSKSGSLGVPEAAGLRCFGVGDTERVDVMCGWGSFNLSQEASVQGVSLSRGVTLRLLMPPSKPRQGLQPHSLELGPTGNRTGGQGGNGAVGRARRQHPVPSTRTQHPAPRPGLFRRDPRPARLCGWRAAWW